MDSTMARTVILVPRIRGSPPQISASWTIWPARVCTASSPCASPSLHGCHSREDYSSRYPQEQCLPSLRKPVGCTISKLLEPLCLPQAYGFQHETLWPLPKHGIIVGQILGKCLWGVNDRGTHRLHGLIDRMHRSAREHAKGEVLQARAMPRIVSHVQGWIKKQVGPRLAPCWAVSKLVCCREIGLETQ